MIALTLAVCAAVFWNMVRHKDGPFPPPVQVSVKGGLESLKIFPGVGATFFVLPDGSLWIWGKPGGGNFTRARMPTRVGDGTNWVKALAMNNQEIE